jgi:hypothetical protein
MVQEDNNEHQTILACVVRNVSAPETDPKGELTARTSKGNENDTTKADQERSK